MSDVLLLQVDGPVARLVLNRPQALNALNLALVGQLDRQLSDLAANEAVRVLVLTGSGPAFCAGADLKEVLASGAPAPGEADFLDRAAAMCARLRDVPEAGDRRPQRRGDGRGARARHVRGHRAGRGERTDRRRALELRRVPGCGRGRGAAARRAAQRRDVPAPHRQHAVRPADAAVRLRERSASGCRARRGGRPHGPPAGRQESRGAAPDEARRAPRGGQDARGRAAARAGDAARAPALMATCRRGCAHSPKNVRRSSRAASGGRQARTWQ